MSQNDDVHGVIADAARDQIAGYASSVAVCSDDPTRQPSFYDGTYAYLVGLGLAEYTG